LWCNNREDVFSFKENKMEKEKGITGKKTDAILQKEMTDAQVKAL